MRFNVERWPPLVERPLDGFFFASLYNPDVGSLAPEADGETFRIADPELVYGSQAVILSVSTACWILDHWDDEPGFFDVRASRLAAQRSSIFYHRPSLVQHLAVPSSWGGAIHEAVDFSPDWRAPVGG